MNNNEFAQITHILSKILQKDIRVMDLCCGDDRFTRWIKATGIADLVPVSPNDMEHIRYENPFVAYNNFINDDRKVPTKDGKADVILLLGPLYNMQSEEKREQTLSEAKRLLSVKGKIITLTVNKPDNKEKNLMKNAGFTVDTITGLGEKPDTSPLPLRKSRYQPQKSTKAGTTTFNSNTAPTFKDSHSYVTVATPTPVPKPVLSVDDIPPQVIIRIPDDVLERIRAREQEYKAQQKILNTPDNYEPDEKDNSQPTQREEKSRDNITENTIENKEEREEKPTLYSNIEIKPSIDPTLQQRIGLQKSIDPTLQPKSFFEHKSKGFKMDLPILPQAILDEYNGDNSDKEIKTEKKEEKAPPKVLPIPPQEEEKEKEQEAKVREPRDLSPDKIPKHPPIPLQPSIDKSLIMREDMSKRMKLMKMKEELAKVHPSIDKSLQMSLPKIDPKYAKPKSRKKGTRNIIQRNVRSSK